MKKLYILAALLLATTSAHAGGISFQIEGQRVRIEAPRGCASLSCINITAPGFKGLNPTATTTMMMSHRRRRGASTATPTYNPSVRRRRFRAGGRQARVTRATSPSATTR